MTEVNAVENEVVVEFVDFIDPVEVTPVIDPADYTGLAAEVYALSEALVKAADAAYKMESGLTKKTEIIKSSKDCRDNLLDVSKDARELFKKVIPVRSGLLESIGTVQAVDKRERLLAKQKEIADALAALDA